ncbi:hypothetical protein LCGC14_3066040 [marine sediment metagenome]|uniref:Uncharacterized protein n=1 Tax=marine sediment metagenome TaxID=412755 RepID=A0A0F8X5R4_9ZZZZ
MADILWTLAVIGAVLTVRLAAQLFAWFVIKLTFM